MAHTLPGTYLPRLETMVIRAASQYPSRCRRLSTTRRHASIKPAYAPQVMASDSTIQRGSIFHSIVCDWRSFQLRANDRTARATSTTAPTIWTTRHHVLRSVNGPPFPIFEGHGRALPFHRSIGADAPGARRTAAPAPRHQLLESIDVRPVRVLDDRAEELGIRRRGIRVAQGRREIGMPQSHPEPFHLLALARELERVRDPGLGILDPLILALRAIHPMQRHLIHGGRLTVLGIPPGDDVGDAETKAIAVGKPERRVVGEPGLPHRPLSNAGPHLEEVLPDAPGPRPPRGRRQPDPFTFECGCIRAGGE